jgi:predicted DCC family thiol-disulfide oxidoreductase YuxK
VTTRQRPRSTRHGAGGPWLAVRHLTVLYDADCRLCRAARRWLESRDQLVPLEFVPAGSAAARERFPGLDHAATLRDLIVVADSGAVYAGDAGWLACLWALEGYRESAAMLASPALLPVARRVVAAAAAIRARDRARYGYPDAEYDTDCGDGACARPGLPYPTGG